VSVLDRLFADRAPAVRVLTPLREWALTPGDLESFALAHGLGTGDDGDDVDVNLWGRSWRPAAAHPVSTERLRAARVPAGAPASVAITFASGVPVLLNGVSLPLAELLTSLETLAVLHGVGHTSTSTLACDAPAAVVLHAAHRALAQAVYGPDLAGFAAGATAAWTQLVESGRWFSPLRGALDAFFAQAQQAMHGCVRLQLSQGTFTTLSTEPAPAPAIVPVSAAPSLAQH
jgi:argininosuccinate synthase